MLQFIECIVYKKKKNNILQIHFKPISNQINIFFICTTQCFPSWMFAIFTNKLYIFF